MVFPAEHAYCVEVSCKPLCRDTDNECKTPLVGSVIDHFPFVPAKGKLKYTDGHVANCATETSWRKEACRGGKPIYQPVCSAHKFCVGIEADNKIYCYGKSGGCLWSTSDCTKASRPPPPPPSSLLPPHSPPS